MDDRTAAVLAHVSDEETLELTRQLVRIPSITGQEGRRISEHMATWLRDAGLDSGIQDVEPDRANVWARVEGNKPGKRLLLNGHLDTKPVENMTIDPFGGRPATEMPRDHPLVVATRDAAEAAAGVRPKLAGFPGGCSAGVLRRRDGTQGVIIGSGNLEQAHSADEGIEIEQIGRAARIYAALAVRLLG